MQILIPEVDTVHALHEVVLHVSPGRSGVHDEKLIQSAVTRPITYTHYKDYDLDTICAILIDGLARYHGFKDGNKRTALLTAIFTYRLNDTHFRATAEMNNDFDELVVWVVRSKPGITAIRKRLKELRQLHEGDEEDWKDVLTAFIAQAIKHKDR